MPDKTLICQDCRRPFTFNEEDQAYFAEQGYADPKRCPECRKAKQQASGTFNASRRPTQSVAPQPVGVSAPVVRRSRKVPAKQEKRGGLLPGNMAKRRKSRRS